MRLETYITLLLTCVVSIPAWANGNDILVEMPNTQPAHWSLSEVPTIGSFLARLDVERDVVVAMYRPSYEAVQYVEKNTCRKRVEALSPVRYRMRDVFTRDRSMTKQALLDLVESMSVTGRVLDYAPFDPLRFGAEPEMNRRLREGDLMVVLAPPQTIWIWDVGRGWHERPHAPAKSVLDYGREVLRNRDTRGDFAYWIGPRGEFDLLGVAPYNRSSRVIPPGSILFFPPPGFGRSEQPAYQCIGQFMRYQDTRGLTTTSRWSR